MIAVLRSPAALRRLALASLVANVGIVGTGGAVRLTGSGLGCPTWPRCSTGSYVTTPALGVHGIVEFGNRTLTFVLAVLALLVLVAVLLRPDRTRAMTLGAAAVLAGIPAQAVVGGVTVLTHLNPWVVSCHFLVSMGVIAAAYLTWHACAAAGALPAAGAPAGAPAGAGGQAARLRRLAWLLVAVAGVTVAVGTVVTASGPHAGDAHARRTGLDPAIVTHVHTGAAALLVGLSLAVWLLLGATDGGGSRAGRIAGLLVAAEAAQGVIGVVQAATGLPAVLVGLHMIGSCLVWVGAIALLVAVTRGGPAPAPESGKAAADVPEVRAA